MVLVKNFFYVKKVVGINFKLKVSFFGFLFVMFILVGCDLVCVIVMFYSNYKE